MSQSFGSPVALHPPSTSRRGRAMQSGIDFIKGQLDQAIALHSSLVASMTNHEGEAEDTRYRDLCERHLPHMRQHQSMLEEFRLVIGAGQQPTGPAALAGAIRQTASSA